MPNPGTFFGLKKKHVQTNLKFHKIWNSLPTFYVFKAYVENSKTVFVEDTVPCEMKLVIVKRNMTKIISAIQQVMDKSWTPLV